MKTRRKFWTLCAILLLSGVASYPQQPAATDSALAPITSIDAIAAFVPPTVSLRQGNGYSPVGIKQAEDAIVAQAQGKPAVLRYTIEALEPTKNYGFAFMLMAPISQVNARGIPLRYRTWAYFTNEHAAELAKLQKGGSVILSGTLEHCNITMLDAKPLLRFDLTNARIYDSINAATADLAAKAGKTVDLVKMGDPASEQSHGMLGERIATGTAFDRSFREALNGGLLSYKVRVLPNKPTDLVLTFWGSDNGAHSKRQFEIFANDVKIGSQTLENNHPGEFFDERYTIPAELTRPKVGAPAQPSPAVTVRIQPLPGALAGGIFGLRTEPAASTAR